MEKFIKIVFTPYFEKVLVSRKRKKKYWTKQGGNLHGKRVMCMHHIMEKCRNPNFLFYHAQAKELDSQYIANECTVIAPGMEYILEHGAADIQIPAPVGSMHNMDN